MKLINPHSVLPVMIFSEPADYMPYIFRMALRKIPNLVLLSKQSSCWEFKLQQYNRNNKHALFFSKVYRHLSTSSYDFELFCFLRWFYIYEYAYNCGYEYILHFDTDVAVCENLTTLISPLTPYNLSISYTSAHTGFFHIDVLKEFCDFLLYFGRTGYKKFLHGALEALRHGKISNICDMVALSEFYKIYTDSKANRQVSFSHNINNEEYGVLDKKWKICSLYKKDNSIYIKNIKNEFIPYFTIHWQGPAKKFIPTFYHFYYSFQQAKEFISYTTILNLLEKESIPYPAP